MINDFCAAGDCAERAKGGRTRGRHKARVHTIIVKPIPRRVWSKWPGAAETHPDVDNDSVLVSIGTGRVVIGSCLTDACLCSLWVHKLTVDCCGYRYPLVISRLSKVHLCMHDLGR